MPNKVFISYRREDSQYQAGRIYEAFVRALPPDTVFMDVDSMAPGDDFVEALEGWVQQCDVLLALIGPRWIDSIDPRTNLRRLDNPEDFVRIEIRGALERKIPVVPVLLDAAKMPTAAELPDDIKALPRRNAGFVDFRTFDTDVQRLITRLKIGKKIELPSEAPGSQAEDVGSRFAVVPGVGALLERINLDAVAAKPLLLAAAAAVLAAGAVYLVMSAGPPVGASAGLADFAKSEEGRRVAEIRASQATDALAIAEKARQEAEVTATAAAAAQAKSDEGRRAAETRASDAEARATSALAAQAKAEEAQRTADKARLAAEGAASGAATARAKADNSRQFAEARANDFFEALKKSEAARQQAEAKIAAPAKSQQNPYFPSAPPTKGLFLADLGSSSRWALDEPLNCGNPDKNYYSLTSDVDSITWTSGYGADRLDIEAIISSGTEGFATRTRKSRKGFSENFQVGTTWNYSREGERMRVKSSIGHDSVLVRCP
jgi:hypothetical protein